MGRPIMTTFKVKNLFFFVPLLLVLVNCGGGGSGSDEANTTLQQTKKQFKVEISDLNIKTEEQNKKVVTSGQVKKVGQATLIVVE